MKPNEGKTDRIIRVILGSVFVAGGFFVSQPLSALLWIAGGVLVFTGAIGICGLYSVFGINTCGIKKQ